MKKKITAVMVTAALTAAFAFTAFAGEWGSDEKGSWYKNDSGSYAREQMMVIDGVTYGFDQSAYMVNGWKQYDSKWYYFEPGAGNQVSGWKQVGDNWYYLNPNIGNVMQTSWQQIGAKLYYFQEDGSMVKAGTRFYVGGFAYDTDDTGAVKRNVTEEPGNGRILIYESDGRIKYKNDTLLTGNKAAGNDVYVYLTENNEAVKTDTATAINDAINDKKDELYEKYKEDVRSAANTKKFTDRQAKWEEKVRRQLTELSASAEDITAYILEVEYGQYGDSEWGNEEDNEEDNEWD
ncbi:MAG: hypothetical protein PHV18_12100 [Lachnospiraceae bacterium]|nr:hypothetical protein [Lachnospiraceae bacterium]